MFWLENFQVSIVPGNHVASKASRDEQGASDGRTAPAWDHVFPSPRRPGPIRWPGPALTCRPAESSSYAIPVSLALHPCLGPLLTFRVKYPVLCATHTHTPSLSLKLVSFKPALLGHHRTTPTQGSNVLFLALQITLAMCTLLFWLLLYSQDYSFFVLGFVTL